MPFLLGILLLHVLIPQNIVVIILALNIYLFFKEVSKGIWNYYKTVVIITVTMIAK